MSETAKVLARLQENISGTPWHGTSLRGIVEGVPKLAANARPFKDAHTLVELLAHVIAWIEIVTRRVEGEEVNATTEMDFPSVDGVAWGTLLERLDLAVENLLLTVAKAGDEGLAATVAGKSYTVESMLDGLMHHNTYHAGQMALLKKAN